MTKPVDFTIKVSPTLHPANITGLESYTDENKGYVSQAVHAMDVAYKSVAAVIEARTKIRVDSTRTEAAKILETAKLAERYSLKIQRTFESTWNELSKAIAHTESAITQPIESSASSGSIAAEIRSHFKTAKPADRKKQLTEALAAKDNKTLHAVLGAPCYLSGFTEVEFKYYTQQFHTDQNPGVLKRLELMKTALKKMEQAHPVILIEMDKAIGVDKNKVAQLKKASSATEEALILRDFANVG